METYRFTSEPGVPLTIGSAVGTSIGQGKTHTSDMSKFKPGEVLVAHRTDPDWEPTMKRESCIVTDQGGRTCHAAIISRELGIPAVVGCGDAADMINSGSEITVSCTGEQGSGFQGLVPFEKDTVEVGSLPSPRTKILLNVGNPNGVL